MEDISSGLAVGSKIREWVRISLKKLHGAVRLLSFRMRAGVVALN